MDVTQTNPSTMWMPLEAAVLVATARARGAPPRIPNAELASQCLVPSRDTRVMTPAAPPERSGARTSPSPVR
eukprot:4846019-Pyramimonas_sp.AAC.1